MIEIDIDHLSKWVGTTQQQVDIVSPRLLSHFKATMAPFLAETDMDEAPLAFHWVLSPDVTPLDNLGPDGHSARGEFLPPVSLPRRMWAGGQLEMFQPLHEGDEVTRTSTIKDVVYKQGRTGPLVFVTVEREYTTKQGLAIWEKNDLVFREAEAGKTEKNQPLEPDERVSAATWQVAAEPMLLFRYSALTFNSHRIHYDLPYATKEEYYDGLIVHGPLQASLMLNLVAKTVGKPPQKFSYRGRRPLFAGAEFSVQVSSIVNGKCECWVKDKDQQITMMGEASWDIS